MTPSTPARFAPHLVYTGRATNWPVVLASMAFGIPLLVLGAEPRSDALGIGLVAPLVAVLGAIGVNLLTATNVRTVAGPNGVTVRWGVVGWPRVTYRLDQIRTAEVIRLPWWAVALGFWWTPQRTCCTVRPGPTLRLTLTGGRTVTVTVPDPGAAVAAIEAGTARTR